MIIMPVNLDIRVSAVVLGLDGVVFLSKRMSESLENSKLLL